MYSTGLRDGSTNDGFARRTDKIPDEDRDQKLDKMAKKSSIFQLIMRTAIILLSMVAAGLHCRADVKFVNFNKLDPDGRLATEEKFLLDNLGYFDHWTPAWPYEISRDSLVAGLKNCLRQFEPLTTDEYERDLLLGEVAHYLYNLGEEPFYDTAQRWYLKAIRINDKDCRGYWFLGYAFATSDRIADGIDCFQKALPLVTKQTGVDFWQEYAFTMEIGNMPFHARWALTTYLQNGGLSLISQIMDSTLRTNLKQADPAIRYSSKALWESSLQRPRRWVTRVS